MPTYKTPDVYVEEISLFPPSVAEVATAIPAFIGYTEKAKRSANNDLDKIPTKIKSLLDFETYFGKGPALSFTDVQLDENNNFIKSTFSKSYCLYDSVRLFFDNGGGDCYVVSVGLYNASLGVAAFKAGLDAVSKYDEPTILLFPDAASFTADIDLGTVQQAALTQCGKLGDRVAVLDTRQDDPRGGHFRDNIGITSLKYGAAYSPWLKVNYPKSVSYKDVQGVITKSGTSARLNTLTTDSDVQQAINKLDNAISDVAVIKTKVGTFLSGVNKPSINAKYLDLVSTYANDTVLAHKQANIRAIFLFLYSLADLVDDVFNSTTELKTDIKTVIGAPLVGAFSTLLGNENELKTKVTAATYPTQGNASHPTSPEWLSIFTNAPPTGSPEIPTTATSDDKKCDSMLSSIDRNFGIVNGVIDNIRNSASQYVSTYDSALYNIFPAYKNIILGISDTPTAIPPSGAVAGVYATIDNQRGVFKAPANVSLAGVVGPDYNFDASETDDLNVDSNAGKSINAIRTFSGKGTLVWGARTLAGNDNEWRYVNVRRFFNMVEESIKKSTYWAVFEANDANTWVKLRGMIENYLTQKWREGALAGATTKDAFFVKCGLGTTMTSQDILEGRLNVEVGMAVVRPAEFIILKFSHKLQTS